MRQRGHSEWAYEGNPRRVLRCDGNSARYKGNAYDGMQSECVRVSAGEFGWYRRRITLVPVLWG